MSKQSPRFTNTGRARTFSDRHDYLKPQFWADPANQFWEADSHTERSKAYFRQQIATLLSNPHNLTRIQNANDRQ